MKKIFTLMAMLCMAVVSFAGDVYSIAFNGANAEFKNGEEVEAGSFFSWNKDKHNFHAKFTGATYAGITFTKGLKMEGDTKISFTNAAEATVIIVQSTWSEKTIKFDGTVLEVASAEAGDGCRIYTLKNVAAGSHSITRGDGENGLFYISVEYTGAVMTQLAAPAITFDPATGTVTIAGDAAAKEVIYSTDGKDPGYYAEGALNANTTVYAAPFAAEDGTVVKAISVGDNTTTVTSPVATETVLLTGITISEPKIVTLNGTVAIVSGNSGATIEYSINGGEWQTYTRAFTLTEDATVKARASREGCTASGETSENVKAVLTQTASVISIVTDEAVSTDNSVDLADQVAGHDYSFKLTISGNASKAWSNGNAVTYNGTEYKTLKVSNGAQNTIVLPEGYVATKATFVSYVNIASSAATVSGWKEIDGETIDYQSVPMGAFFDLADYATNPDIRVFPINGKNEFTFTNAGSQLCFVLVVEMVAEADYVPTGIQTVKSAAESGAMFNAAGQQVGAGYKGLVIKNGRKYIVK